MYFVRRFSRNFSYSRTIGLVKEMQIYILLLQDVKGWKSLLVLHRVFNHLMFSLIDNARRIFDYIQLDDIAINLSGRNNVIHLNSLIHNQLSSHLFVPMIKYSWFASGYINQHPEPFETVNDICFDIGSNFCQQPNCNLLSFIQCSYYRKFLCFE